MIKAIETRYKGYRFRSRLEARWAVFFDALKVKWEYEKEGFILSNGERYLPDFWLPEKKWWFEVKPHIDSDDSKARELAGESFPVIVAAGNIGEEIMTLYCFELSDSGGGMDERRGHFDGKIFWYFEDYGREALDFEWNRIPDVHAELPQYRGIRTQKFAYDKARSARFEHGENR